MINDNYKCVFKVRKMRFSNGFNVIFFVTSVLCFFFSLFGRAANRGMRIRYGMLKDKEKLTKSKNDWNRE